MRLFWSRMKSEIDTTLRHHLQMEFKHVAALMPVRVQVARAIWQETVTGLNLASRAEARAQPAVKCHHRTAAAWIITAIMRYLFFPFCETRGSSRSCWPLSHRRTPRLDAHGNQSTFNAERSGQSTDPCRLALERCASDRSRYYALAPPPAPRNFFWENVRGSTTKEAPAWISSHCAGAMRSTSPCRRKIRPLAFFKAARAALRRGITLPPLKNTTYACRGHNIKTATICSFRHRQSHQSEPAALRIETFKWHNSAPFEWHSRAITGSGADGAGAWFDFEDMA